MAIAGLASRSCQGIRHQVSDLTTHPLNLPIADQSKPHEYDSQSTYIQILTKFTDILARFLLTAPPPILVTLAMTEAPQNTPPTPPIMKSPRMNCVVASAAIAFALIGASNAQPYTLKMVADATPGKFTVDPAGSLESVLSNYDDKALVLGSGLGDTRYWTFCLESSQHFQGGKLYNATTSLAADSSGPAPSFTDPISVGTAYLYREFALGTLDSLVSGFSYTNVALGGEKLQKTIWWLEGESGGVLDSDLGDLLDLTFGGSTNYLADYTGSEVGVLNLTRYDGPGGDSLDGVQRQDNLVFWGIPSDPAPPVSVPDGGTSALLLGLSLGGLGAVRRFLRA